MNLRVRKQRHNKRVNKRNNKEEYENNEERSGKDPAPQALATQTFNLGIIIFHLNVLSSFHSPLNAVKEK